MRLMKFELKEKVRNANLVALVTATQHCLDNYHQAPKPYKTQAPSPRQTTSTRSHATTRNKVKEIVKSPSPESELEEDSDEEHAQRDLNLGP
ncbi:hypothetical protein Tco_1156793 [Tanacetum coccineum]